MRACTHTERKIGFNTIFFYVITLFLLSLHSEMIEGKVWYNASILSASMATQE